MYLVTVLLLLVVLPIGSIAVERLASHNPLPLMLLVGKWFVFWSAGVRLALAGLRQFFQPRFTSREIFRIQSYDALPIVRELGVANFATGVVAILSIARPGFVLPMAIAAAIFYGVAGIRHAGDKGKNRNQTVAMVSDLFVSAVFVAYIGYVASR